MISSLLRFRDGRRKIKAQKEMPEHFASIDELCRWHFLAYSDPSHINRVGLTFALRQLDQNPALIIETGTSAWGTDSTKLWAKYVENFGGTFHSVDIRKEPRERLGASMGPRTHLHVNDSVNFLSNFSLPADHEKVDFVYLDSWDLDLADPLPAMKHGLEEWKALYPLLGPGSIVVIDDTPIEPSLLGDDVRLLAPGSQFIPGKGTLLLQDQAVHEHFQILYHHYNVVMKWVR
jgi:hypothetical protein